MIKIGLFALLIISSIVTSGQTEGKNNIGFKVGPSFPICSFAKDDFKSDEPGFALLGVNLELSYSIKLSSRWGYLVALKVNSFPFDDNAILEANDYPDDGTWRISIKNYNIYGLYTGLFYECVRREKFSLQVNGMAGLNSISYPTVTAKHPANPYFNSRTDGDNSINLTYCAKTSAFFYLSERFKLSANVGYMHTRAKYDTEWSVTLDSQSWSGKETNEQPISAIDLGIGLIYKLE